MGNGPKPHESAGGGNRFGFQASGPLTDVNTHQSPVYDPSLFTPSKNSPQIAPSRSPGFNHDSNSNANLSQHNSDGPFENDVLNAMGTIFHSFDKILTLFSRHRRAVTRRR